MKLNRRTVEQEDREREKKTDGVKNKNNENRIIKIMKQI